MALMAPISELSKPFMVDTRYPTAMIKYSRSILGDMRFGFCSATAAVRATDAALTSRTSPWGFSSMIETSGFSV